MSTDTSTLVAAYQSLLIGNLSICTSVALGCYEYLITIKYEVEFLRKRKWSATTWIFLANRYLIVAMMIYEIAPYPPQYHYIRCNSVAVNILCSLVYLHSAISAAASSLRIFALLQRDSRRLQITLSGLVLCLGISVSVSQVYESATISHAYVDDPVFGPTCVALGSNASPVVLFRVYRYSSRNYLLPNDYAPGHLVENIPTSKRSLVTWDEVVFEQYTSARCIFFLLSLIESIIVVCQQTTNFDSSFIMYLMVPIMFILQPILLSRFLIHLRQLDTHGDTDLSANSQPSHFSLPNFHMPTIHDVIGNMGEPFDFGDEGDTCNMSAPEHIGGNDIRIATLDSKGT